MKKIVNKIGVFITTIIAYIYMSYFEVQAAETLPVSSDNKMKIFIGIIVLCVITILVTLKRIIYAKKNN